MAEGTTFPPPTPDFEGLEISLITDKEVYELGDIVYVTFLATNTLDDTWTFLCDTEAGLAEDPGALDDMFRVEGWFWQFNTHNTPWIIEIPSLATLERHYEWDTVPFSFDQEASVGVTPALLLPGDYVLTVTFAEQEFSKIVTVVPEPGTLTGVILGIALLGHRRRRHRLLTLAL
jgi:hypothetical protein